jgi:hypothetical protein
LDGVFAEQRKELQLTKKPRKGVVDDIAEGKNVDDVQKVQMNGRAGTNLKDKPTISG